MYKRQCYRCLLSYYNQPEHELINRTDLEVIDLLSDLAQSTVKIGSESRNNKEQVDYLDRLSDSSLEKAFINYLQLHNHILPDDAQQSIPGFNTRPDFIYRQNQTVIYIDGPHHENPTQEKIDDQISKQLTDSGITVIRFTKEQSDWSEVIAQYPDIFGGR